MNVMFLMLTTGFAATNHPIWKKTSSHTIKLNHISMEVSNGVLFRCNCTWPWAGGAAHCNIHHATGPKCPWCNVMHGPLRWLAWAITDNTTIICMVVAYCSVWALQYRRALKAPLDTIRLLAPSRDGALRLAARRFGLSRTRCVCISDTLRPDP